jgi:hypothetical protein
MWLGGRLRSPELWLAVPSPVLRIENEAKASFAAVFTIGYELGPIFEECTQRANSDIERLSPMLIGLPRLQRGRAMHHPASKAVEIRDLLPHPRAPRCCRLAAMPAPR